MTGDPAGGLSGLPIREDLRGLTAYGAPQIDVPVRLNTNENPYPPPAELAADLAASVAEVAAGLNRYPDRDAVALRAALVDYLSPDLAPGQPLDVSRVWPANGSNEVIQQLLQVFGGPGRLALGFTPSYSMHRLIALATGTRWEERARTDGFGVDADQAAAAVRELAPSVVFLCSPNNPTATALTTDVVTAVYDATDGVVVVDEAYAEFSHAPSLLPLLVGRPRLVVTRTMSKAFGFAGARLGYLAADPAVVEAVQLVRLPYHLSALTQAAALAALRHSESALAQVAQIRADRDALVGALRQRGYDVTPSDANFVLFGGLDDERATWRRLVDEGVLVRDVALPGRLRVSVGTPQECAAFLAALDAVAAPSSTMGA